MEKKPLRIVHTVSTLLNGGMEHFVLRLAAAQRAAGHDAVVVAIKTGPLLEQAEAKGIPAFVLHRSGKIDRLARGVARMALLRPDVVHAHNTTSLHYALLGKIFGGARVVMTDHAQINRVPRAFEWYLTDAAVAVSGDTARKSTANSVLAEVLVFHNGIDVTAHATRGRDEVRAELGVGDALVAIHVARFVPLKAQDVIVRAIAALPALARVTAVFVGDGPDLEAIRAQAAALGLGDDRARFLGFRTDVADLLGAADIFLLPSRTEGLPLSVLEGMASRLPIVATPVGGVPELCTEGEHGLFVPVDDPVALAAAIARLAADPALRKRLGDAGHDRVVADFSFDAMTRRYESLYRDVLARGVLERGAVMVERLLRRAG